MIRSGTTAKVLRGARFEGGLWSVRRSIAGQHITFEAPTHAELKDLVDLAVSQQMNALNRQRVVVPSDATPAVPTSEPSSLRRLLSRFSALFRSPRADPCETTLPDRGRRDPAGATGGQRTPLEKAGPGTAPTVTGSLTAQAGRLRYCPAAGGDSKTSQRGS